MHLLTICIFCETHGCKLDLVNAKIHLVNDNMHFVMPVCILSVTIYVLTELMDAMDGCVGTRAERLVIAGTYNKVQIVADKMHPVSAHLQFVSCQRQFNPCWGFVPCQ